IGMSAVAGICLEQGITASGSAIEQNQLTTKLQKKGMVFFLGHKKENVGSPDLVVMSAAVPLDNPEIVESKEKGVPVCLYSEFLGELMGAKMGVGVAGTHGKTTTTAIIATVLQYSGVEPTVVCGGVMKNFGSNSLYGRGQYFIAEACEYRRSFLNLKKKAAVVTNIEPDHLECYGDIEQIKKAFADFINTTSRQGFVVVNGDDPNIQSIIKKLPSEINIITVGEATCNQYRIADVKAQRGYYSLGITSSNKQVLDLTLPVPGRYNCTNAALASIFALNIGINSTVIANSVKTFKGTERRMEYLGRAGGDLIYSDYAHHPTEIKHTLDALREEYPQRHILVVFQPHQHSRTVFFLNGFADTLVQADSLVLVDIYLQRDSQEYTSRINGYQVFKKLRTKAPQKNIVYIKRKEAVIKFLKKDNFPGERVVVFMGAGSIDNVAREYAKASSPG
ncbi:MAG: UDP-N-acetylmuramate--L-alanine ligase, partial [Spirochaetota bacterium]